MRIRTTTAAIGTALLLALTACSSDTDGTTVTKSDAKPETPAATTHAPPKPTQRTSFTVGETASVDDTAGGVAFSVALIAYTQPVKGPQPPEESLGGDVWATIEVKVCNTKGKTFTVSQFPWSLAYEDGTRLEVTGLNGGDLPKPEFAPSGDVAVTVGDCLRGKIPFAVPSSKRPNRIIYAPTTLAEPLMWDVPTK